MKPTLAFPTHSSSFTLQSVPMSDLWVIAMYWTISIFALVGSLGFIQLWAQSPALMNARWRDGTERAIEKGERELKGSREREWESKSKYMKALVSKPL